MENTDNSRKFLGTLLLGAAIGGALGILFAPDKGSETRKRFSARAKDPIDALKEKLNEFIEEVKMEVDEVKKKASGSLENGANRAERVKVN
jgi:gas vesicle protein